MMFEILEADYFKIVTNGNNDDVVFILSIFTNITTINLTACVAEIICAWGTYPCSGSKMPKQGVLNTVHRQVPMPKYFQLHQPHRSVMS